MQPPVTGPHYELDRIRMTQPLNAVQVFLAADVIGDFIAVGLSICVCRTMVVSVPSIPVIVRRCSDNSRRAAVFATRTLSIMLNSPATEWHSSIEGMARRASISSLQQAEVSRPDIAGTALPWQRLRHLFSGAAAELSRPVPAHT